MIVAAASLICIKGVIEFYSRPASAKGDPMEAWLMQVLVVEDEALVAMLLKDMLSDIGHDVVITAGRLQDALTAAAEAEIDFAVVDLNLRGESTFEVGERLKARRIPFFFATGYGAAGLPAAWTGHPTLQKPFQPSQLEEAVAECVALIGK